MNMHHYWVGTAADSWRMGDKSVGYHSRGRRQGRDLRRRPRRDRATKPRSSCRHEGREGRRAATSSPAARSFGSLTPVWTRLGLHGLDTSDPKNPKVVHGFLARNTPGVTIKDTWDVMGMRATRSDDTVLEGAFVPDSHIVRIVPAGLAGADYFVPVDLRLGARRASATSTTASRSGCSSSRSSR